VRPPVTSEERDEAANKLRQAGWFDNLGVKEVLGGPKWSKEVTRHSEKERVSLHRVLTQD
jgi:hypothetical protein